MQSNSPPLRKRLNLIQTFRGFAAILVTLFHLDQLSSEKLQEAFLFNFFKFGWAGVDFFFVLSGFIIIYAHRNEIGIQNKEKYKEFWLKRFIRIYPAYWVVTLIVLCFILIVPSLKNYDLNLSIITSFVIYPKKYPPIISVSWTLALEIAFYFIFSLTILLRARFYIPIITLWIFGAITQFIGAFSMASDNPWLRTLFNGLNIEFALGGLAAYLVLHYNISYRKTLLFTGIFIFLLFGVFRSYSLIGDVETIVFLNTKIFIDRVVFFGIPSFLIVMGAASIDINKEPKIPDFFNYLGDASYSIYLTHGPVISALVQLEAKLNLERFLGNSLTIALLIGLITISIGCLFYSVIEKPLIGFLRQNLLKRKAPTKLA
jgi:peptidoglycan/LPS O-acetylase OafA/YrhL